MLGCPARSRAPARGVAIELGIRVVGQAVHRHALGRHLLPAALTHGHELFAACTDVQLRDACPASLRVPDALGDVDVPGEPVAHAEHDLVRTLRAQPLLRARQQRFEALLVPHARVEGDARPAESLRSFLPVVVADPGERHRFGSAPGHHAARGPGHERALPPVADPDRVGVGVGVTAQVEVGHERRVLERGGLEFEIEAGHRHPPRRRLISAR